jgi:hypothetical protein
MVGEALELLLAKTQSPPHLDTEQDLEGADKRVESAGDLVDDEWDRLQALDVQLEVGACRRLLREGGAGTNRPQADQQLQP